MKVKLNEWVLTQHTVSQLYIIFPQQVVSWLFFFCSFISKDRDYWTQSTLKGESKSESFPVWRSISEFLLYLQTITKKEARKQDADIQAQFLTPYSVGFSVPHLQNYDTNTSLSFTNKAISLFPCIYIAHRTSVPNAAWQHTSTTNTTYKCYRCYPQGYLPANTDREDRL